MTGWAFLALVLIPEPASLEFHIWERLIELIAIPVFVYVWQKLFTTRSEINNKTLNDTVTALKEIRDTVDVLNSGAELLEHQLNEETRARRELEREYRRFKQDVDRGLIRPNRE